MCMGRAWDTPVTAGIMVRQADQARPAAYEAQMTLQFRPTTPHTAPTRPALDGLTAEGRDALLDLMWAAWYSSRTPAAKELLAGIESGDPLRAALAAGVTTEASLKLMRLRRVAVGDPDTIAIIDALREGAPHLHVPMRLRRVMAASDDDRRRMLVLAQDETATLPPRSAEVIAAVLWLPRGHRGGLRCSSHHRGPGDTRVQPGGDAGAWPPVRRVHGTRPRLAVTATA